MKQMVAVQTIYRDAGKPNPAVPVTNGCALPGVAIQGELTGSPIPIRPILKGAVATAAKIIWAEIACALDESDVWGPGPDGTYSWRNQADGVFE